MSLHFVLKVNETAIGACVIRQIEPANVATLSPDTVCVYEVDVHDDRTGNRFTNEVEHRYGDGPWQLARAALGYVADLTGPRRDPGETS